MNSPSHEELIAKCAVHGRRPYNDPEKRPPFRQRAVGEHAGINRTIQRPERLRGWGLRYGRHEG